MIAKQTVYLNEDKTKAVGEGDKAARYLLVREGHEIEPKQFEDIDGATELVTKARKEAAKEKTEPHKKG